MCMTCGKGTSMTKGTGAYRPSSPSKGAPNPFASKVSRPSTKMNHSAVASAFYGIPKVSASFKIGK